MPASYYSAKNSSSSYGNLNFLFLNAERWPWYLPVSCVVTTLCVFFLELFLFSPLYSYGALYLELVGEEVFLEKQALWPVVFLIATYKFSNPWTKELCEFAEDKQFWQRCIVISGTLMISLSFLTSAFAENIWLYTILYGTFGGIGMSLMNAQILVSTYENFQSKPRVLEAIRQFSRAIGLFIIPHLIFNIDLAYGLNFTQCIYSAILLNMLPAGLILTRKTDYQLKRNKNINSSSTTNVYRTCSGYLDDPNILEMSSIKERFLPNKFTPSSPNNKLQILFNPEEECFDFEYADESSEVSEEEESLTKPKTISGVEIMPVIIEEESETESSEPKQIETTKTDFKTSNIFQKKKSRFFDLIKRNVEEPLLASVKNVYFLPAVFTKTIITLTTVIFLVHFPYLSIENSITKGMVSYTDLESIFLLSLMSFTWLFFLITLIWLLDITQLSLRITYIVGLLFNGLCFYLTSKFLTPEFTTANCLVFGLGFGIVSFTEDFVLLESFGLRNAVKTKGCVNVCTALLIIIFYTVVCVLKRNLHSMYLTFSHICLSNIIIWILLPITHFVYDYFKRYEHGVALIT